MLMLGKFFNIKSSIIPTHYLNNTNRFDVSSKGPLSGHMTHYNKLNMSLYFSGRHSRESNEDISETRQQTTVVKHEYSESDGNTAPVIRSARYTSTKSQKTTTMTVKTTQSDRVLTNGDHEVV
jgi:hypothetical protein